MSEETPIGSNNNALEKLHGRNLRSSRVENTIQLRVLLGTSTLQVLRRVPDVPALSAGLELPTEPAPRGSRPSQWHDGTKSSRSRMLLCLATCESALESRHKKLAVRSPTALSSPHPTSGPLVWSLLFKEDFLHSLSVFKTTTFNQ